MTTHMANQTNDNYQVACRLAFLAHADYKSAACEPRITYEVTQVAHLYLSAEERSDGVVRKLMLQECGHAQRVERKAPLQARGHLRRTGARLCCLLHHLQNINSSQNKVQLPALPEAPSCKASGGAQATANQSPHSAAGWL